MLAWFWYFSPALSESEVYTLAGDSGKKSFADTDEDGLADWEEALWQTDPKNPDSDGDGILDGAETRDAPAPSAENSEGGEDLGEPPNLTEAFSGALARSLGPRILQEGGLKNIPLSDLQAAASYLPSADALLSDAEVKIDLEISEKNDPASVKKYFENVFAVYEGTFFELKEDDLAVLEEAFATENYSLLSRIDPIIQAFDESIESIKKIPVPRGWENFATQEIEYLIRSREIVEKFKKAGEDPMTALVLLPKRVELMAEINKFHEETGKALGQAGIIFLESEEAYQLFY